MILMLTETYTEAQATARNFGLLRSQWKWVNGNEDVAGMGDCVVLMSESFGERRDYREIYPLVRAFETWKPV